MNLQFPFSIISLEGPGNIKNHTVGWFSLCVHENSTLIKEKENNLKMINIFWFGGKEEAFYLFVIVKDTLCLILIEIDMILGIRSFVIAIFNKWLQGTWLSD